MIEQKLKRMVHLPATITIRIYEDSWDWVWRCDVDTSTEAIIEHNHLYQDFDDIVAEEKRQHDEEMKWARLEDADATSI